MRDPIEPENPGLWGIVGHDPPDGSFPVLRFYIARHPGMTAWPWCYFHGQIESWVREKWAEAWAAIPAGEKEPDDDGWCAPDLLSSDIPVKDLADGIWECEVYGKKSVAYVWTAISGQYHPHSSSIVTRRHAYVVDPESLEDVKHAEGKYFAHADML